MTTRKYILVTHFSEKSKIDGEFIHKLHEYGLIKVEKKENESFILEEDIAEIEKLFRLHRDLDINYEGLDVIRQMLNRMQEMEKKLHQLRNRLRLYE